MTIKNVLSIAGTDPTGGAGIHADLKAFSAMGAYGMAAITAVVAQNTRGVRSFVPLDPSFVGEQIDAVFDDGRVEAVKLAMVATAAIAEVLGEAATAEVGDAWTEVYCDMADALVRAENVLYDRFEVTPGDVWRELVVISRVQESPTTISLELAREDGAPLPEAQPGQYLSLQVTLPDGAAQIRQYSLTKTSNRASWAVTIKAEPGRAESGVPAGEVANFIHNKIFEADTLRCSLPYGDLVVEESDDPLLLVSAGIGCTPIIGALNHLVQAESIRPVTVLHADQSMASHAHRREMAELVDQLPGGQLHHWYEQLGARTVTET
ncbi:MAG: bifunctional hydroxymethylpyrimidine kinase/phosphomethylpyrimidine kinase, partial [Brevibacterium sp.]|nr:bifunctional hydroxymethylpyrimidine kinase/phosphomethylpyrimidine kinase [Brevibacterium sp.]